MFENPHHAYAIFGRAEQVREKLFNDLEKRWGVEIKGNPDFSYQKFETLSVDEARLLKEFQTNKSLGGGKKILVIEADAITVQAQNSLLKMFEEPTANSHFFLIGDCVRNLIPTLASRLEKMEMGGEQPPISAAEIGGCSPQEFISSTPAKRLALIKKLADDIKDEKKTKADAISFLREIEAVYYQKIKREGKLPDNILADIEMCLDYMSDPSASVKMLLEFVAMILPFAE